jgi:RHS repeat-associated protein
MFDENHLLAGVGEYDPFGRVNRVLSDKETPHPYYPDAGYIAGFGEPPTTGLTNQLRVHYQMTDLRAESGGCVGTDDQIKTTSGSATVDTLIGASSAPQWGNWITSDGGTSQVQVSLTRGSPQHRVGLSCSADPFTSYGAVIDGYQYRRYQPGSTPFWVPITFQGMYADQESDLYQNWNRFYDPSSGRYLEPDPAAVTPNLSSTSLDEGLTAPIYSYAADNPIGMIDPDGDFEKDPSCPALPSESSLFYAATSISDPELRACVDGRIISGYVSCSGFINVDRCGAAKLGLMARGIQGPVVAATYKPFSSPESPAYSTDICLTNCTVHEYIGVLIHEFAHACGWEHCAPGTCCDSGVPGEYGNTTCKGYN